MTHTLRAVIGPNQPVTEFAGRWVQAHLVSLPQHFGLVPVTDILRDDIQELAMLNEPKPFVQFYFLSAALAQAIREATRSGPLAYIETDYFGGIGSQSAVVWNKGQLALGPLITETKPPVAAVHEPPLPLSLTLSAGAINQALRYMGVWTRDGRDEFDMLDLRQYRNTEEAT